MSDMPLIGAPPPAPRFAVAALPLRATALLRQFIKPLVWHARLLYRWQKPKLRPRLNAARLEAQTLLRRGSSALLARLLKRENWQYLGHMLRAAFGFGRGWLLWYWRRFKTNPDTRLATFGLLGGFTLPLLALTLVLHFFPLTRENSAALGIDESVPVPDLSALENETFMETDGIVAAPGQPQLLSPRNFRFELFIQRDGEGKTRILHHVAEHYAREWFPVGSPAVNFMRFFGHVLLRAGEKGETSAEAARHHCMVLPINRVFRQNTIVCTYGHGMPDARLASSNPKLRVFWIISLSNDRNGNLTELQIHARTTEARP